ncbi:MAG: ATP-binding cassette domain-containing protein [Pyrinomonadaceae bacterium]
MIYALDSITKHYMTRDGAVHSLNGLSFGVKSGERLAMIGKSGAGKTTLFRLLNATLRPTSGTLHFDKHNVGDLTGRELRAMRRRIGTIYQQHHLVSSLSALDNTLCGRLGHWSLWRTVRSTMRPTKRDAEEALHALESVGLADKRFARADELSGGQQQRLAIARVLLQKPDVILADEPVASLDPTLAENIITLLIAHADEQKRTLIVTLHAVELALRHFPRIVALREGRLAFDTEASRVNRDTLEDLYANEDERTKERNPSDADTWRELRCTR